jgi:hypothetical protein
VLRLVGLIFAAVLVVNLIGLLTGAIPEDTRLALLALGGLGLALVAWRQRREP